QWPRPKLNSLTPCGGKVGTTCEVTFAGSDTDHPESLWFSHGGIKGTPIIPPLPPVDPKAKPDPNKKPEPPPVTKFSVTIDKAVPPGFYDVRFVNKHGVSNPRIFVVGDRNEVAETDPKVFAQDVAGLLSGEKANLQVSRNGKDEAITATADESLGHGREIAAARPALGQDGVIDAVLPADGDYLIRLVQFTYTAGGP